MNHRSILSFPAAFLCLLCVAFFAPSAFALPPPEHEKLMEDKGYGQSWQNYSNIMETAKTQLSDDEYTALKNKTETAVKDYVGEALREYSFTPAEAYASAFDYQTEEVARALRRNYLQKNPDGPQGWYELQSDAFDGTLAVEAGKEKGEYVVDFSVMMKGTPNNSGEVRAPGRVEDGRMVLAPQIEDGRMTPDPDPQAIITLSFKDDSVEVTSSGEFRNSGYLGANVFLDGTYKRVKK